MMLAERLDAAYSLNPYTGDDGAERQVRDLKEWLLRLARDEKHLHHLTLAARKADEAARGYLYGALLVHACQVEVRLTEMIRAFNPSRSMLVSDATTRAAKLSQETQVVIAESKRELGRGALRALGVTA